MQKLELYNIPGKVVGHYHPQLNAIIDTWESLLISLEDWKASVYDIGITDFAPKNGVTTWIIDTSNAIGVFKPEVQEFRAKIARPKLQANGVRFLFVVLPHTAIGKLSARKTANIYSGQSILQSFQVASIDEAVDMLQEASVL